MSFNEFSAASQDSRDLDTVDVISMSATSLNETESDLLGSGRLLGNLYMKLGRHVEDVIGRIAHSMGRGPISTAKRIRNLAPEPQSIPLNEVSDATVKKKLAKDCKLLIKYTKSRAESTRRRALDEIIALSLAPNYCGDVFRSLGSAQIIRDEEPYVWDYCTVPTRLSSRMALSCVLSDELYNVTMKYDAPYKLQPGELPLTNYIRKNIDDSYILLRMICRNSDGSNLEHLEVALLELIEFAEEFPQYVEWEEVHQLFTAWLDDAFWQMACFDFQRVGRLIHAILVFKDKLPGDLGDKLVEFWLTLLEKPSEVCFAHLLLLSYISYSSKGDCGHHSSIEECRKSIRRYLNKADLALARIARNCIHLRHTEVSFLPRSDAYVKEQCSVLASCIKGEDTFLRDRALRCINPILVDNIHVRAIIKETLYEGSASHQFLFDDIVRETGELCRPIQEPGNYFNVFYRHLDREGRFRHMGSSENCIGVCDKEEWMRLKKGDYQLLRVYDSETFYKKHHTPILAGYTSEGKPTYCAQIQYRLDPRATALVCQFRNVFEGMTPRDVLIYHGLPTDVTELVCYIFIFRYELETYPRRYGLDEEGYLPFRSESAGSDATGPYSWHYAGRLQAELLENGVLMRNLYVN